MKTLFTLALSLTLVLTLWPGNVGLTAVPKPALLSSWPASEIPEGVQQAQNVELVGQIGRDVWEAWGVTIAGHYAYVGTYSTGLRIVDISNPAAPVEVGVCDTPGTAYELAVAGNYAYVADWHRGLCIINVADPAHPSIVGSYDTSWYFNDVVVVGNIAYVTEWSRGLYLIDVTNPANPTFMGFYDSPGSALGVAVEGNIAYLADGEMLRIIDVSNPANPVEVGSAYTSGVAYDVAVAGDMAYVAANDSGLAIFDVSTPAPWLPQVGCYDDALVYAREVAVEGDFAYVVEWSGKLHVINVANPAHPVRAGFYFWSDHAYAEDLAVAGQYAYIVSRKAGGGGLIILSCNPPSPTTDDVDAGVTAPSMAGGPPGGVAVASASASNQGRTTATAVVLTATLDSHLVYASASPEPVSVGGDTITWNLPDLLFLDDQSVVLYASVPSATIGTRYPVTWTLTSAGPEAYPSDNATTTEVMVARQVFLPCVFKEN